MTLAAVAPVSSDQTAIWVVIAIVAAFAICAVLYQHERVSDRQGAEIAWLRYQMRHLLKDLGREIPPPVKDDSPKAMAAAQDALPDPEPATDELPVVQPGEPTEPMPLVVDPTPAVQARRDAAWDEQRPSPVPRGKSADWVEDAIKGFDYSGRKR